jgi:hypothetical protein
LETVTPILLVGQFVDADARQAGQPVGARLGVGADPGHDRPDRAPINSLTAAGIDRRVRRTP